MANLAVSFHPPTIHVPVADLYIFLLTEFDKEHKSGGGVGVWGCFCKGCVSGGVVFL